MKKVVFIAVALIVAIGALGVGYASWTDSVTINGTVETGTVCFNASNPTGTWVFKDIAPLGNSDDETYIQNSATPPGTEDILVASATTAIDADGDLVTLTFSNLFPIEEPFGNPANPILVGAVAAGAPSWLTAESAEGEFVAPYVADFDVCNCGTIPVKIQLADIDVAIGGNADFEYGVMAINAAGAVVNPLTYQLEPKGCLHMVVWMALNELDRGGVGPDAENMGLTGTITGTIMAMQWNEEP